MRKRKWYGLIIGVMLSVSASVVADDDSALNEWLDRQVAVETWAADVEQTRKLRALVTPLVAKGRVTFAKPQRFRWQSARRRA